MKSFRNKTVNAGLTAVDGLAAGKQAPLGRLRWLGWSRVFVLCLALAGWCAESGAVTTTLVTGNAPLTNLQFCISNNNSAASYHFFRFHFYGLGASSQTYQAFVNGAQVNATSGIADSAHIAPSVLCTTVTLSTAGLGTVLPTSPISGPYVEVSHFFNYAASGDTYDYSLYNFEFVTVVKPQIQLTSSIGTINTENTTIDVPVQLFDGTAGSHTNLPYGFLSITANPCSTAFGATISSSPSSLIADAGGNAKFSFHTTRLIIPLAGGEPSGSCSFIPAVNAAATPATVQAKGQSFDPTLAIKVPNPPTISHTGTTNVTTKIGCALCTPLDLSGAPIKADCTASGGVTVTVAPPSTAASNFFGETTFAITAPTLVGYNVTPAASCSFSVTGGSAPPVTLAITTGDACQFGLAPNPPQCGNP